MGAMNAHPFRRCPMSSPSQLASQGGGSWTMTAAWRGGWAPSRLTNS